MKAWRLEAEEINERRKAGSKEPTARVQKVLREARPATKWRGHLMLTALLYRAGVFNNAQPELVPTAG